MLRYHLLIILSFLPLAWSRGDEELTRAYHKLKALKSAEAIQSVETYEARVDELDRKYESALREAKVQLIESLKTSLEKELKTDNKHDFAILSSLIQCSDQFLDSKDPTGGNSFTALQRQLQDLVAHNATLRKDIASRAVAIFRHKYSNWDPTLIVLYPDGSGMSVDKRLEWTRQEGNKFQLTWIMKANDRHEQICEMKIDGSEYSGKSKSNGEPVSGELIFGTADFLKAK